MNSSSSFWSPWHRSFGCQCSPPVERQPYSAPSLSIATPPSPRQSFAGLPSTGSWRPRPLPDRIPLPRNYPKLSTFSLKISIECGEGRVSSLSHCMCMPSALSNCNLCDTFSWIQALTINLSEGLPPRQRAKTTSTLLMHQLRTPCTASTLRVHRCWQILNAPW